MAHDVTDDTTRRFMDALLHLEKERDLDPMAELFTDDAEVRSIDGHGPRQGPDGIRELFEEYLRQFDEVATTFTVVTEGAGHAAMEWTTEAVRAGGHQVSYVGVTIIDLDGGSVTGFRTVYDSAALMGPTVLQPES